MFSALLFYPLQQFRCGFVVGVLGDELAAEGLGKDVPVFIDKADGNNARGDDLVGSVQRYADEMLLPAVREMPDQRQYIGRKRYSQSLRPNAPAGEFQGGTISDALAGPTPSLS